MIRVGVLGYGYWGPNIVRNFHSQQESEVVLVCDKTSNASQRLRKVYPAIPFTTDENELMMSYTVPSSECAVVGLSTWCHEPATNLIGDVFRHPPSVAPKREARRERSLSKDVQLAACFEKESQGGKGCRLSIAVVVDSMSIKS